MELTLLALELFRHRCVMLMLSFRKLRIRAVLPTISEFAYAIVARLCRCDWAHMTAEGVAEVRS
jgi:hypothetical protein